MSFWIQYPNLTFSEEQHDYRWNNRPVPSVTHIPDCIGYRKNDKEPFRTVGCPDFAKREHDSTFGSAFHKMANAMVLGKVVSFPEEMLPWHDLLKIFNQQYPLEPMCDQNGNTITEYPLYSQFFGFAGTPDLFALHPVTNKLWLVDWKSTEYYQKNYSWQTAGYEILIREIFGGKIFGSREKIYRATVLFSPDKQSPEVVMRDNGNNPEDRMAFLNLLSTYKLAA